MIFTFLVLQGWACCCQRPANEIRPGAERMEHYLPLIGKKKVALVANHTSLVGNVHLVDTLIASGIGKDRLAKVFAPEHGFRGNYAAGATVRNGVDEVTGIPVISLYGNNRKPSSRQLEGIDMVIFDLQDVGVRFYTYISTLTYVMEACAEHHIPLLVLDRPNPNGYVDGPVLEPEFSSFVGMHPIPVVYGLTIGELAGMINGEGWLTGGLRCDLTVIPCENYRHGSRYPLPVGPSPNLPVEQAVMLYPSTCFFEGTVLSEGRGTPLPFQVFGHPDLEGGYHFTPVSIPGVAEHPKFENVLCHGENLSEFVPLQGWTRLYLRWLIDSYRKFPDKDGYFTSYFELLAGTADLRKQIEAGWDEDRIRESWQDDLAAYQKIREKYLLYE
ncbi:MAG: exo-beta-N-acetylmuramidase NamZ family protein [Bacteroidales bacterium]